MHTLQPCPSILPDEIERLLTEISRSWAESLIRPRLKKQISGHWDKLIQAWIDTKDLPLYIRKRSENRGQVLSHMSGRKLIPTDNSPAHWSFIESYRASLPTIDDIHNLIKEDKIPIAMAFKREEKKKAVCKGLRSYIQNPNNLGWKICHKFPIGLKQSGRITEIPIEKLEIHFRYFMSPSNMFLIPKKLSGLGEIPKLAEIMKNYL